MLKVRFLDSARADIDAIISWFDEIAPESVPRILADIDRSIRQLRRFPRSGAPIAGSNNRRIVTRRYHFKIAYLIDEKSVAIVGVFRFQDRSA